MELYEVMRTTAAIREFTDDPLPDEVLSRILDNARFAPSGGNRQGAHLVLVTDRDTREALAGISEPATRRYAAQGALGQVPWNPFDPAPTPEQLAEAEPAPRMMAPYHSAAASCSGVGAGSKGFHGTWPSAPWAA